MGLYDGNAPLGVLSASKMINDTVQMYSSATFGSAMGVGLGVLIQGTNTYHVDAKLGADAGLVASWKRDIYGYAVKVKGGVNASLGGIIGFVFMRKFGSGRYSMAVDLNHSQGVSLVLRY